MLNVYVLTRQRTEPVLWAFLAIYGDIAKFDRETERELQIEKSGLGLTKDVTDSDDYETEPAGDLTGCVHRGLEYPRRAFDLYIPSRQPTIDQVIVGFTRDDQVVLGFALDDEYDENLLVPLEEKERSVRALANSLLMELGIAYQAHLGLIIIDTAPPASEPLFRLKAAQRYALAAVEWRM